MRRLVFAAGVAAVSVTLTLAVTSYSQEPKGKAAPRDPAEPATRPAAPLPGDRPEATQTDHDKSPKFDPKNAVPLSPALKNQPDQGKMAGFDFGRDPLNAKRPMQPAAELMKEGMEAKPKVMGTQRKLLEARYDLTPKPHQAVKMSRGKPVNVGPTAKLAQGVTWEQIGGMTPDAIRDNGLFPYRSLPHPLQAPGGMVFIPTQVKMFPRLERFDVDHDLPEAFLPEFPPAMFLTNRPELGDVSRGQVVTADNFYTLFKDILTPQQMDGLKLLVLAMPQEDFNLTEDRRTPLPQLGVACFDCHVNGHTSGQFVQSPDIRPQERRFRLDTPTVRGAYNQQIFGSKRSVRSLIVFSRFEMPRAAYFNGDPSHAAKKGAMDIPDHLAIGMERFQMMLDWPPAPKLDLYGRLDPAKATEEEKRGEKLFFGKARCAECHPAPFYLDDKMHDLRVERFIGDEAPIGPIKTFSLRGIKDSPPYLHDGRCLTLDDVVEFFNLVQGLKLTQQEKADLVAFLLCL